MIGIAFGFFTEYLLGNTRIYENIVRKATMRRLSKLFFIQMQRKNKMTLKKQNIKRNSRSKESNNNQKLRISFESTILS